LIESVKRWQTGRTVEFGEGEGKWSRKLPPSKHMADGVWKRLAAEYPEYPELYSLLALGAVTWPRYGLSAAELARMSESELELIRLMTEAA